MKDYLEQKVVNQQVSGVPMERYLANLCVKVEEDELKLNKAKTLVSVLKELNSRHKIVIDAQRAELKMAEFENKNRKAV